jgi:quercetin dioxygenase-like cupin family protein
MREHDHGPSAVTLIVLSGRVQLGHNGDQRVLDPGTVASIDIGARVSLGNPHPEPATLLAVITPPDFANAVSNWPTSTDPASEPAPGPAIDPATV